MSAPGHYSLQMIDDSWRAVHKATLLFVVSGSRVLLIRKKRGLGAGKINGPGGKLDPGETLIECATREIHEELGVVVTECSPAGRLRFQFIDGYSIDVAPFIADRYEGIPVETEEAIPLWFKVSNIPYHEMWEDDRIWLPRVLAGEQVNGRFIFDGDRIVEQDVSFTPRETDTQ